MQAELPSRFQEKLNMDIRTILNSGVPDITNIILFGSCARGEVKITSDLDLLVLTKKPVDRALRGELRASCDEPYRNVTTDLVFYTEEDFNRSDCLLVKNIKKDGVIVWTNQ
ncbi:MAG: hypothetical protein ACFWTJ_02670 [Lachnoclostridium sp.]|jgi:uncharacterized protein